jgi:pimeloyl-ACP methyl ester carboxylesterase
MILNKTPPSDEAPCGNAGAPVSAFPVDRYADLGGRRLRYWDVGEGTPTIVIEGATGGTVVDWTRVLPGLARLSRVIVYDRAGYGKSDPDPHPRTARRLVSDLRTLLAAIGVSPPYVLVGHSWGGTVVRLLTYLHPKEVAGLVLVDSSNEDFVGAIFDTAVALMNPLYALLWLPARLGLLRAALKRKLVPEALTSLLDLYGPEERQYLSTRLVDPDHLRAMLAEFNEASAGCAEMRALKAQRPPFDVPVISLSAGAPVKGMTGRLRPAWHSFHRQLAANSRGGELVIAYRSIHYIQLEEPELVVNAVRRILSSTRPGKPADTAAP